MIYLDSAATSFLHPQAKKAIDLAWEKWGNPSSMHQLGRRSKIFFEGLREELRVLWNIPSSSNIIFTSCASESNALVFNSVLLPKYSVFSHPSVYAYAKEVEYDSLEEILSSQPCLLSLPLVQHETGLILPIEKIVSLVKKYDCKLHVDASQAKNINFAALECDYLTISSHKLGGPIGIAALISKTKILPLLKGGAQEYNMRAGTQAVPLVAGFVEVAKLKLDDHFKKLRKILEENIEKKCFLSSGEDFKFSGHVNCLEENIEKKCFLSSGEDFKFSDHIHCLLCNGSEMFAYMDLNNICVSNGSACVSGAMEGIKFLKYFGHEPSSGIRVSFGWHNTESEILEFCKLFSEFVK